MADAPAAPSLTELPFRFRWLRAVQDSGLKPTPTLVAYAFGQYVGADKRNPPDTVWLSLSELQRVTRLSRDAANRGTHTLREAGWLVTVTAAAQHRSVVYRAAIPGAEEYESRTAEQYVSRTADRSSGTAADITSTSPDTSGTGAVPHKERTRKYKEPGPSQFCERHAGGSRGMPCRACGEARRRRRAWEMDRDQLAAESASGRKTSHRLELDDAPDCPHGVQGGDVHRPWLPGYSPRCATCRRTQPKSA
jgi:hypothetical protein